MTRPRPEITARAVTRSPGRAPVPGPLPPGPPTDGRGSDAAPAFSGSDLDPARGTIISAAVGATLWAAAVAALGVL